ncbi:uncharacterized protein TNCV_5025311 [Trichonephila clavipes]|nr:uncharacterized protein TNCV_5025311 [Trichonephila clavipes]
MPLRQRSIYQQLTEFEKSNATGLQEGRFSFRDIAERLPRNVCTVHDCWEQWLRNGTASRRQGSGYPRGTTKREDWRIQRKAAKHHTVSVAKIRVAVGTTVTQ